MFHRTRYDTDNSSNFEKIVSLKIHELTVSLLKKMNANLILAIFLLFFVFYLPEGRKIHRKRGRKTSSRMFWRQPGFWRPSWIIERKFFDEQKVSTIAVVKLANTQHVNLISKRRRPLISFGIKSDMMMGLGNFTKKQLIHSGTE